jgi:hypothetical protein
MNRIMKNRVQFLEEKKSIDQILFNFLLNFKLLESLLPKIGCLLAPHCHLEHVKFTHKLDNDIPTLQTMLTSLLGIFLVK